MKIIITGSLGHISLPLTKILTAKGHTVTVISSKEEKKKEIEALGATAAIGSLEDAQFLASTFAGADALYAMIPPNYAEPDPRVYYRRLASAYAGAIRKSGIRRVVHLSSMGAELEKGTGFILGSHDAEIIFNELPGVSVTHLRAAYFYYNLNNFSGMIKAAGFIGANYGGDDRIVMVHPSDIADAAAEEISAASGEPVKYIASDDRTGNEAATVLGRAIGKPDLKWNVLTNEQMQDGMEKNGLPAATAAVFTEMGASIHSGAIRKDFDLRKTRISGKIKLEEFAKQFALSFK